MISSHLLQRADAAIAAHQGATNPVARAIAKRELVDVKEQLEAAQRDDAFTRVFKATPRQSMVGAWLDKTERDRPVFFYAAGGARITKPVTLPDGTKAAPNPEGQIVVPASMIAAMIARGFVRVNDGGKTALDPGARTMRSPVQVQGA